MSKLFYSSVSISVASMFLAGALFARIDVIAHTSVEDDCIEIQPRNSQVKAAALWSMLAYNKADLGQAMAYSGKEVGEGLIDLEDTRPSTPIAAITEMAATKADLLEVLGNHKVGVQKIYFCTERDQARLAGNVSVEQLDSSDHTGKKARVTLAFHGTENSKDWLYNLKAWKTSGSFLGLEGQVHQGFLNAYLDVRDAMFQALNGALNKSGLKLEDVEIHSTGHSLGGAIATLAAYDVKMEVGSKAPVELYTFGSPRVADKVAAQQIKDSLQGAYRIWRDKDPVPAVSLGTKILGWITGFKHVGDDYKLGSKSSYHLLKNHSMNGYYEDAVSSVQTGATHVGFWSKVKSLGTKVKKFFS